MNTINCEDDLEEYVKNVFESHILRLNNNLLYENKYNTAHIQYESMYNVAKQLSIEINKYININYTPVQYIKYKNPQVHWRCMIHNFIPIKQQYNNIIRFIIILLYKYNRTMVIDNNITQEAFC